MFMTRPSSRACLATVGLTAALATTVRAQDQPFPPVFEVAAIKPHNPSDAGGGFRFQHGRLTISNTELKVLVMSAYGVNQLQVSGGPNWMDSERFDMLAQAPDGSDHRHLSPMLPALLADRFKLAFTGRPERPTCTPCKAAISAHIGNSFPQKLPGAGAAWQPKQ